MINARDHRRFEGLTFDDFRRLAGDATLSAHERIGFPDEYRAGFEAAIVADMERKLPALAAERQLVLDVGPGCGAVAAQLIARCRERRHTLLLADSAEVLAQLPDDNFIHKMPGRFPADAAAWLDAYAGRVDAVIVYSVLQYVFVEGSVFDFVDRCLALLAPGGRMLIGDIPNASKRKRFFASAAGVRHHQAFTGSTDTPAVAFNSADPGHIDDAVVVALLLRARAAGYDAYLMPQPASLPMANRREDVVISRP